MKHLLIFLTLYFYLVDKSLAQIDVSEAYGDLFTSVQLAGIFEDSKTFPDCAPRRPARDILNDYQRLQRDSLFSLKAFILENFRLPEYPQPNNADNMVSQDISSHLIQLWSILERPADTIHNTSLIPLPYPYIVPGGRFREIYYWDSYFTMLGLIRSGEVELAENMLANFAHLLETYGHIPNGNRAYYLSRSQPPFFSLMVDLIAREKGDSIYTRYLPHLQNEYDFWMWGQDSLHASNGYNAYRRVVRLPNGAILNRYWDDLDTPRPESYKEDFELGKSVQNPSILYRNIRAACESGWDFSSRWLSDPDDLLTIRTTELVPVDLNCLLYHLENVIARCHEINGDKDLAKATRILARKRKKAIALYCWNKELAYFTDYDFIHQRQSAIPTMAGSFCLFFKIATSPQAKAMADIWENRFLKKGGLTATLINSAQQWDAPNGWPPLQYMAIIGLQQYKLYRLSGEIARRWLSLNKAVFEDSGKMMEKYNVVVPDVKAAGGEYPTQDGFGWTNGIYLQLSK